MQPFAYSSIQRLSLGAAMVLSFIFGSFSAYADATSTSGAVTASDLTALKNDFNEQLKSIQSLYEQRIQELEKQLAQVKTTDTSYARAEQAAEKAEIAAAKAEQLYSSTYATQDIQNLANQGETFAWRKVSDLEKGFEFHGMMRANAGLNGNGGPLTIFQAPLVGGRYSLGNRNDTYGEFMFVNNITPEGGCDDVKFRTEVLVAYTTKRMTSNGDVRDDKFSAREVFGEAIGVIRSNPNTRLWVGQRYYLDPGFQINTNDIANYSGYGFGFTDMEIGDDASMKLAVAYIGGTFDELDYDGEVATTPQYAKNNLIFALKGIPCPYGSLKGWFTLAGAKGRNRPFVTQFGSYNLESLKSQDSYGFAIGAVHTIKEFLGGYNQISLAYGRGAGANFSSVVTNPVESVNRTWNLMASESFTIQPVENISLALVAIAQYQKLVNPTVGPLVAGSSNIYSIASTDLVGFTWLSFGVRPVYHFNRYVDIAVEGAVDYTKTRALGGANGILYKGTVALEVSPDFNFSAKPVLRLFATAATWSNGFKGLTGGNVYKFDQGGYNIGASVEATW